MNKSITFYCKDFSDEMNISILIFVICKNVIYKETYL